jgi:hypothetical protein
VLKYVIGAGVTGCLFIIAILLIGILVSGVFLISNPLASIFIFVVELYFLIQWAVASFIVFAVAGAVAYFIRAYYSAGRLFYVATGMAISLPWLRVFVTIFDHESLRLASFGGPTPHDYVRAADIHLFLIGFLLMGAAGCFVGMRKERGTP